MFFLLENGAVVLTLPISQGCCEVQAWPRIGLLEAAMPGPHKGSELQVAGCGAGRSGPSWPQHGSGPLSSPHLERLSAVQVRWRPGGRRAVCVLLGGDGGIGNCQVAGESERRERREARPGGAAAC